MNPRRDGITLKRALYFARAGFYPLRVSSFSLTATYYYGFFGYNRWGPRSSVR